MKIRTLGTVATYINGRAFKPSEWENVGKPIIRIQNLSNKDALFNYSTGKFEEKYLVHDGDLLFAWSASLGAHIWKGEEAWLNQHIFRVVPNEDISRDYLYFYLLTVVADLYSKTHGSGMVHITKAPFMNTPIPVPPFSEQKRIVARIEELFSELDSGVETLKKTKQQLAVYRQAVLKAAFEGRLTRTYRETKGFEKWEMVPITAVIAKNKNALKAGPFGSALKKDCYVPSGYKVYGQEQVIAGDETIGNYYINKKKYEELSSCAVAPEDVLISLVGTVGKVLVLSDACLPGIINPRLIKVTLDATKMLPLFFKYYFESAYLKSLYKEKAHGATMDVLNMGMIKELPFPFCNVKEQRQVIAEIESRLSVCDSIEKTVDAALQQAESMRQSILKKAFEGGL